MNDWLCKMPLADEIWSAISSTPLNSSPGPDGLSPAFYKAHWTLIKGDVMKVVAAFFNGRCSVKYINATFITLILIS